VDRALLVEAGQGLDRFPRPAVWTMAQTSREGLNEGRQPVPRPGIFEQTNRGERVTTFFSHA